jgi:hypothetical protein
MNRRPVLRPSRSLLGAVVGVAMVVAAGCVSDADPADTTPTSAGERAEESAESRSAAPATQPSADAQPAEAVVADPAAGDVALGAPLVEVTGEPEATGAAQPAPTEPQFVATFDTAEDFYDRFQTEVFHGVEPHDILSWSGDHDMDCGAPASQREVQVDHVDEMFWWCPPRPDAPASSGHLMTSMNTTGYAQVNFAPTEPLTDVRKVCWDQNMTDLGGRKWTQVVIVPEETYLANDKRLDYVKPGLETDVAVGGTHLTDGVFMFEMLKGSTAVYTGRNVYEPNFAGFQAGAEKSRRFTHCITDLENGTVQIDLERDTETETRISGGAFPPGPVRVIFQDDNYNPPKSPPETAVVPDPFTWHWDNIEIY